MATSPCRPRSARACARSPRISGGWSRAPRRASAAASTAPASGRARASAAFAGGAGGSPRRSSSAAAAPLGPALAARPRRRYSPPADTAAPRARRCRHRAPRPSAGEARPAVATGVSRAEALPHLGAGRLDVHRRPRGREEAPLGPRRRDRRPHLRVEPGVEPPLLAHPRPRHRRLLRRQRLVARFVQRPQDAARRRSLIFLYIKSSTSKFRPRATDRDSSHPKHHSASRQGIEPMETTASLVLRVRQSF